MLHVYNHVQCLHTLIIASQIFMASVELSVIYSMIKEVSNANLYFGCHHKFQAVSNEFL